MIDNALINSVLSLPDSERGGDNALDGFEFQVSAAIYLIFEELKMNKDFTLVYEKLEDFIIFTDKVSLYQAKSISCNLTPNVLYRNSNSSKKSVSKLSIIEKMYDNYESVKNILPNIIVESNLIICATQKFSKKLSSLEDIIDRKSLNFNDLSDEAKEDIINNTKNSSYDWENINSIRLIPKQWHEEITRIFIEDVINIVIGENKINSQAFYNSLTNEIRKIRKEGSKLTKDFILFEMNKFSTFNTKLEFNNYTCLLNDLDQRSLPLMSNFDSLQSLIFLKNSPYASDYTSISYIVNSKKYNDIYEIYDYIQNSPEFDNINIRLSCFEIKALILIAIAKE